MEKPEITIQATPPRTQTWSRQDWIFALVLVAALLLAYQPAWNGSPIWDDAAHLTKPQLCSWAGLGRIWFERGATQQYYPVAHSAFWLQHWLWGEHYAGYHLVNIVLHAFGAVLLVQILRHLKIRGAWLAAAIWALHPMQVESVAWMSELKNTLSGVLYLSAALLYLRFYRERSTKLYLTAFGLFILGLLTKSVIATLPAALLLVCYWQYGKVFWRKDIRPLIPFFGAGIVSGLFTAWVERTVIGADGGDFHFSLLERGLIAGRAFWFYPAKLIWPANLTFIYPRWTISSSAGWQFLFPVLALGLVALLIWRRTTWGRAPLVAVLYFACTLLPALGFLNIYPFRFSFVADHFQYLACIGPIVLLSSGLACGSNRWMASLRRAMTKPLRRRRSNSSFQASPGVARSKLGLKAWPLMRLRCCAFQVSAFSLQVFSFALLAFLTYKQSAIYANMETLWRTTIARNPECWMAYNNLGLLLDNQGSVGKAITQYQQALRFNPAYAEARNNLGLALLQQGRTGEAIDQFRMALQLQPTDADAQTNLGSALLDEGRIEEAIEQLRAALRINPTNSNAHNNLGNALFQRGQTEEAIDQYRDALRINPAYAEANFNLGNALFRLGRTAEAVVYTENASRLQPANLVIQNELAWLLATVPEASLRNGTRALALAMKTSQASAGVNNPLVLRTLAAAYAETGDFPAALQTGRKALELAEARGSLEVASALRREIKFYEVARPFRDRQ